VYQRYFHFMHLEERVAHERLVRICFADYDREIPLVAEIRNPGPEVLAVGRLSKTPLSNEAELAVIITDKYQGKGLGTELTRHLLKIAEAERMERVTVSVLADNAQMRAVCSEAGFRFTRVEGGVVEGEVRLTERPQ
jgi:acetyltransferase